MNERRYQAEIGRLHLSTARLSIRRDQATAGESVAVSLQVKNVGRGAGDEVVQLDVRDDYASTPRPAKVLPARDHRAR